MFDLMAKETIETIKNMHRFRAEFDLMMHIGKMVEEASYNEALRKALKKAFLTSAKKQKYLDDLVKATGKLMKVVENTPESLKTGLDNFLQRTVQHAAQTTGKADWSMYKYNADTKILNDIAWLYKTKHPKEKVQKNNRYSNLPMYIMRLAAIYHEGTGITPECKHDRSADEYSGNFYDFLIALKPVLCQLGVNIGKPSTIGRKANPAIKKYGELLKEYNITTPLSVF